MASAAVPTRDLQAEAAIGRKLLAFALALTALAYLATLRFDFVYDDISQIVNNPTLTTWRTIPTLFTAHTWKFLQPDWGGNYYRPLFMTWLLLNVKAFGLNAAALHATTLFVHLVATWLSFVVARQLIRNPVHAGYVALLFGLHPVHVEAVAWISGVTEPLVTVFVLAAFWFWFASQQSPETRARYRVSAFVCYVLACLCKETALLLPVVLVASDVLIQHTELSWKNCFSTLRQSVPLWITAFLYLLVRALALRGLFHSTLEPQPLPHVLLTVPTIILGYARRLFWPLNLSIFYDTPPVTGPLQIRFWLPFLGLLVAMAPLGMVLKRSRLAAFALIWMGVFISPAILGLPAFPLGEWIHDRYLYLPSFGFCLLVVMAIVQGKGEQTRFGIPVGQLAVVVVLAGAMALGTAYEEQFWGNNMLLFVHATRIAPDSPWANAKLGAEFLRRGDIENSDRLYQKALQLDPWNWTNQLAYGLMLYFSGSYERADAQLANAIALLPGDSNQYFYQGMSRFSLQRYPAAEQAFRQAIAVGPQRTRYHFWLGYTLEREGRPQEAMAEFQQELSRHPDTDTEARAHLERFKAELRKQ